MTLYTMRVALLFFWMNLRGRGAEWMFASYGPSSPYKLFPQSEQDISSMVFSGGASCK